MVKSGELLELHISAFFLWLYFLHYYEWDIYHDYYTIFVIDCAQIHLDEYFLHII
jgi:hypothetical protein